MAKACREFWVQIPLSSCVTLGKLLNSSERPLLLLLHEHSDTYCLGSL